jgi:hypothetical protein
MQSKQRRIQSLSRNCSKRFDFDAARDFEMGQDWQNSKQALDHHAEIRARFRRGNNYEIVALIHALPDRNRCLFSETFDQRWVEVKLDDVSVAIAFQALMESEISPVAKAQDL